VPNSFGYWNLEFEGPAHATAQHMFRNPTDDTGRGQTSRAVDLFEVETSCVMSWRLNIPTRSARQTININTIPWHIFHVSKEKLDVRRVVVGTRSSSKPGNQPTVMREYLWILKEAFDHHKLILVVPAVCNCLYRHNGRVTIVRWKWR